MAQIIVYPDSHVETSTCDGHVFASDAGTNWATIRGAAGSSAVDNNAVVLVNAQSSSPNWLVLTRGFLTFDTSAIGVDSVITNATLGFESNNNCMKEHSGISQADAGIVIVESTQASNTGLVAGDYDAIGTTSFGTADYDNFDTVDGTWYDVALNSNGLAAISKTGITKFAVRLGADFNNSEPTVTAGLEQTRVSWKGAESGSDGARLTVTYTPKNSGGLAIMMGLVR